MPVGLGERRLDHGPRPEPARQHHVDLGAVYGDLHCEIDIREQAEHGGEHAVCRVAVQVVVQQVDADLLQHRVQDAPDDRPPDQVMGRHSLRGEHAEGADVHAHVEGRSHHHREKVQPEALEHIVIEAGQSGRDDHAGAEQAQEQHRAPEPRHVAGPVCSRQVPHLLHGEQAGLRQSGRAPDQADQAYDQPDLARPPELVDVSCQRAAEQWDLLGHRVQDIGLDRRVDRGEDEAEDRHQHEQQGENRDEGGVRQVRHQHAAVVVPVLLHHPEDERRGRVPPLGRIDLPDRPLDWVHPAPPRSRPHCALALRKGRQTR